MKSCRKFLIFSVRQLQLYFYFTDFQCHINVKHAQLASNMSHVSSIIQMLTKMLLLSLRLLIKVQEPHFLISTITVQLAAFINWPWWLSIIDMPFKINIKITPLAKILILLGSKQLKWLQLIMLQVVIYYIVTVILTKELVIATDQCTEYQFKSPFFPGVSCEDIYNKNPESHNKSQIYDSPKRLYCGIIIQ